MSIAKVNKSLDQWFDIHFGDTSFDGNAFIGCRKKDGFRTLGIKRLTKLRSYAKLFRASKRNDYYITANTVKGVKRRSDELFGLQNIVIDVDCHDDSYDTQALLQAFIWRIKRDLWDCDVIPTPNSIVYTGRGVQLWWALVPCYGGKEYDISLYHNFKIKNTLINHIENMIDEYSEELEGLSTDRQASTNPVGYFRMPLTYNTKAKRYGSLSILHTERHDQRKLTLIEDPEVEVSTVTKNGKHIPMLESDRVVLKNYHSLGVRRVMQLINLRNFRDAKIGKEMRNNFNFSVYNALRMHFNHDDAMDRLRHFNNGFKQPMTERELESCIWSAKARGGYKYSNVKLIELLGITPEEQQAIGMFAFVGKHRTKPNASRDAVRKALKRDRNYQIVKLVSEGVTQVEVARILGIGKNTVNRVWKKVKATAENLSVIIEKNVPNTDHQKGSIYGYCLPSLGFSDAPIFRGLFVAPSKNSS